MNDLKLKTRMFAKNVTFVGSNDVGEICESLSVSLL
jgi:hypothetical protein